MMFNIQIYDKDIGKCYELVLSANSGKDALKQAEERVKPWGHTIRGFGSDIKAEGKRC